MPLSLKISLIGYLIVPLGYVAIRMTCLIDKGDIGRCVKEPSNWYYAIQEGVFLAVDWLFTSHYLHVAYLFRLTLAPQTDLV